jgi:hypothetical protein
MLARKSLLAWLAASAWRRAMRSCMAARHCQISSARTAAPSTKPMITTMRWARITDC